MNTNCNKLNGSTAAIPVFDGAGLRHRQNNARQRAALAVLYYRGLVAVEPSQRMAQEMFGACVSYFPRLRRSPKGSALGDRRRSG